MLAVAFAISLLAPEDAATLFGEGRYVEAAEAFAVEYKETGDPALLFGRAQALRRAGNCGAAIDVFEEFIATEPPAPDVEAARDVIDECKDVLGVQEVEPAPAPASAPPSDESPPPPRRRWYADPLGGALAGIGLAVTATGAGLYGASFSLARDDEGESESEHRERRTRVRRFAAAGITLLATGGALLIGGIVRYAVVARAEGSPGQARVSAGPGGLSIRF